MAKQVTSDTFRGEETIEIITTGGHRILLDDASGVVILSTSAGLRIVMDDSNNTVKLESQGNIELDAQTIDIKASGSLSLKADVMVSINGALVKIN